jgi:AsmA-like protein
MTPTPTVQHVRATRRRRRRHLIVGSILIVVLAGVGLNIGLLLDPDEVRRRARDAMTALFTEPVSIESAEFRFPNVVILEGVRIAHPDPSGAGRTAIEIPRVRVTFSVAGVLLGRATPRSLTLEGPSLRVERRADGTLDVASLIRPADRDSSGLDVPRILVRGGRILLRDAVLLRERESIEIDDVHLAVDKDGAVEGRAIVRGFGQLDFTARRDEGSLRVRLAGLRLEAPFARRFAPGSDVSKALARVRAEGPATLDLAIDRSADGSSMTTVRLGLHGVRLVPVLGDDPAAPSYELTDVRGDIVYRDGRVTVEDVTARHGPATILLTGAIDDLASGPSVDLEVRARSFLLDAEIRDLLGQRARRIVDAYDPWLLGDLTARIAWTGPDGPIVPDVTFDIRTGHMRYLGYLRGDDGKRLGFPYALEGVTGRLAFRDSTLMIVWADASHGPVRVQAGGNVHFLDGTGSECDVDISILARDLPIDDDLRDAFGAKTDLVLIPYGVKGSAGKAHVHITQKGPPPARVGVTVDLDGRAEICPKAFPLTGRNLHGRVRVGPDPERGPSCERASFEGIVGDAPDGGRVRVDGWIREWGGPEEEQSITIAIRNAALNGELDRIMTDSELSRDIVDIWRGLAPRGRMDAHIVLEQTSRGAHSHLRLHPRSARISGLPGFPYPLPYVRGSIEVCDGVADLHWAVAHVGSATISARGRLGPGGEASLTAEIEDLSLDGALARALSAADPETGKIYERMGPDPASRVDATLDVRTGDHARLRAVISKPHVVLRPSERVEVAVEQGRIEFDVLAGSVLLGDVRGKVNEKAFLLSGGTRPDAPPLVTITSDPLRPGHDLRGLLSDGLLDALAGILDEGRVAADPLRLSWTGPDIRLDGSRFVLFRPEGHTTGIAPRGELVLRTFLVKPEPGKPGVTAFSGLAELAGMDIQAGIPIEELRGLVTLSGTSGKDLRMTGSVRDLTGRLWRRHLSEGAARIGIAGGLLRFMDLTAILDEGRLAGSVDVRIAAPFSFETSLTMNDVHLGRFLAPDGGGSGPAVTGKLDATLKLSQKGSTLDRLRGKAEVRIRKAELWDIPVFSAIFTALTSAPPIAYRPVFDSADIKAEVRGEVVRIKQMEFRSDFVTLERGGGTVTLFGDVDLTLVPKVRTIDIPGLSQLWSLIKGELVYRVRVEGTLENPSAKLEALPFLHGRPDATPRVVPEFLGKIRRKRGLGL